MQNVLYLFLIGKCGKIILSILLQISCYALLDLFKHCFVHFLYMLYYSNFIYQVSLAG